MAFEVNKQVGSSNTQPMSAEDRAAALQKLADQAKVATPEATVGTDALALSKAAATGEHQYFGHTPKLTLSMIFRQPILQDDRTKITPDQWAQMPETQQNEILAMIPTAPARAQFLSDLRPESVAAKAYFKAAAASVAKHLAAYQPAAEAPQEKPAEQAPAAADAQVDRLNALIEAKD